MMQYSVHDDAYPAPFSAANSAVLMERAALALYNVSFLVPVSALL